MILHSCKYVPLVSFTVFVNNILLPMYAKLLVVMRNQVNIVLASSVMSPLLKRHLHLPVH